MTATEPMPSACSQGGGVGADADRVDERDRPGRVGRPVDGPPGAPSDPLAQQAGHDQRDEQVERERTEPDEQRLRRGGERDTTSQARPPRRGR